MKKSLAVGRIQNNVVDTVTQSRYTVQSEVLTESEQTLEENSGHSDIEQTDGTV